MKKKISKKSQVKLSLDELNKEILDLKNIVKTLGLVVRRHAKEVYSNTEAAQAALAMTIEYRHIVSHEIRAVGGKTTSGNRPFLKHSEYPKPIEDFEEIENLAGVDP